jgi:hypothetical protein
LNNGGAARLAARYPRVWHVMEAAGAGPWLHDMGLLPAVALCDLAGVALDGSNRDDFLHLDLGAGRTAVLRLQQMADRRLRPTLAGSFRDRPEVWRQHIDSHVFFWATQERRDKFVAAIERDRARRGRGLLVRPPVIFAIDTVALLDRCGASAYFAAFNTGSTVLGGAFARRDECTLRPVADYRSGSIAELAIRGRVDLSGIVVLDPV